MTTEIILMPSQDEDNSFLLMCGEIWLKISVQDEKNFLITSNKCNEVNLKKFKQLHKNDNETTKKIYLSMLSLFRSVLEKCKVECV